MAEKLTAQQKRDRQQVELLTALQAEWEEETRKSNNENFTLGMKQGEHIEQAIFANMTLWERITWPSKFRKNL